jgi:Golgi SNAP receptor complex protein 2
MIFFKSRKLAYGARQQLSQVQNGQLHPSELFLLLDEHKRQLDIMEALVSRELPAHRGVWRQKILELREDTASIRKQIEYYNRMVNSNVKQDLEREYLLKRRLPDGRYTNIGGFVDAEKGMSNLMDESESLCNSNFMVQEMLLCGQMHLKNLTNQRTRMMDVKRIVLDIGNKVGITNITMKMIDKRESCDIILMYSGLIIILVVIFFVFCW